MVIGTFTGKPVAGWCWWLLKLVHALSSQVQRVYCEVHLQCRRWIQNVGWSVRDCFLTAVSETAWSKHRAICVLALLSCAHSFVLCNCMYIWLVGNPVHRLTCAETRVSLGMRLVGLVTYLNFHSKRSADQRHRQSTTFLTCHYMHGCSFPLKHWSR